MKKKNEQILAMICNYSNCDMLVTRYSPRTFKVVEMIPELIQEIGDSDEEYPFEHMDKYKLILRPISDITPSEEEGWSKISTPIGEMCIESAQQIHWTKRLNYYRSIGLDCDGLIEQGIAIDKNKM